MTREIRLSSLKGRKVSASDGRYLGRLVEIEAAIELRADGSDYVVHSYHVAHYGVLDWIARWTLTQQLIERLGERIGYRCFRVPASDLDPSTLVLQQRS